MTNLGSDDTPVKGSEFSLPAGAKLDEDNGDLVIRDSAGNIVMRRDETAGEWDIAGIADDPHDNTQHSVDFAEDPHDNTQHSETFLANGENFDGQGTSSLTNLAAVETGGLNDGGIINEGDGTDRSLWIIPAGGSDPAAADPEDLIAEEES